MDESIRINQLMNRLKEREPSYTAKKAEETEESGFQDALLGKLPPDPIAEAAKGGIFTHENGTLFQVDKVRRTIALGDVSRGQRVLEVRLSTGYTLRVNWNDIGALAKCFDAFRPEDVERIMRAIATENHRVSKEFEREQEEYKLYDGLVDRKSERLA